MTIFVNCKAYPTSVHYIIQVMWGDSPVIVDSDFVNIDKLILAIVAGVQNAIYKFGKPDKIITGKAETLQLPDLKDALEWLLKGDL